MNDKVGPECAGDDSRIEALRKLEEALRRDAWERALADLARIRDEPAAEPQSAKKTDSPRG
jgi:hypothetical protein